MLAIFWSSILLTVPMPFSGASRQLNTEKACAVIPKGGPGHIYHVSSRFIRGPQVIFRPSNNQRNSPDLQYLVNTPKCDMGHPKRSCDPPPIVQSKRRTSCGSSIFTIATIRACPAKMRSTSARRTNCAPNTAPRRTAR